MGSLRTSISMVVVAAIILSGLVTGPVSGTEFSFLFPLCDGGESSSLGRFLILEEGPLIGNDTIEATNAEGPVEPAESPKPAEGPDFAVSNLRVPASVNEQSPYEVSFDVENLGDSYEEDIRWEVQYRGAILDAFEYGAIEGLEGGQKVSITVELMADVLMDARDEGSVSVMVDPDESTGDADYGNNAAQQACEIVGMPEFSLTDLFAPLDVIEGGLVDIDFTIGNYGSGFGGDVEWEVVIQSNDNARDDVVLTGALSGLGEDEEERVIASWNTEPGDAGEYVISAVVTTPDDEFDDNEEIRDLRVVADGDLPDIALVDPHIPETLQPGVEFPVEFTVENLGADCAEDIQYDIMYYDERTGEDIWHGDVIHGLAHGESVQITDYWTEYHEGEYSIGIDIDIDDRIEELNEYNNRHGISYHLPPGIACLYAYGGKVPATTPVVAGDTVPISFSVFNVGEDYDGVIDWCIRFYNDNSDEDELSGTIEGILCDETKDVDTSWEVPQGWKGEYHTVLDLNPNERPEYVFEPWQNTGTVTIIGTDPEDSEIQSDSSTTEKSTTDTDVCTSCAAKGEEDTDNENADQESSVDSGESSSGESSTETIASEDSDDAAAQDTGGNAEAASSGHSSHLVEAEMSAVQGNMSGVEPEGDGMSPAPDNITVDQLDSEFNTSSNSSILERNASGMSGDGAQTDAWADVWNALAEGDIWSFISDLYVLLMNGTVSCATPIGAGH